MSYSAEEIAELVGAQEIMDAIDMGTVYLREDGESVHACFVKDDDPGCQFSYIIVSDDSTEFSFLSDEEQARVVADTIWELVDDYPEAYEDEMSMYVDIILNR